MARSVDKLVELAERNLTAPMIELGFSYLNGQDYNGDEFPQDYFQARVWLEKAHARGAATASLLLGTMYEQGMGVPRDIEKAILLYKEASKRGDYLPHLYLARIYSSGVGVTKSNLKAAVEYNKVIDSSVGEVEERHLEEARTFLRKRD